jgi:hypothetical protein
MNPLRGGRQQPHQSLEKLKKYKGGSKVPRNGSLALPKEVAVKPFSLKGFLNVNLSVQLQNYREYYKGEGGGFPSVWAVVSQVSPN